SRADHDHHLHHDDQQRTGQAQHGSTAVGAAALVLARRRGRSHLLVRLEFTVAQSSHGGLLLLPCCDALA
ncbi:uncharacterized protein ACA1_141300, partial [Acanthamoeba castellanii str. Neff]